jgi:menaquinone-dependent protoporphyrinogen IX oxidase
MKEWLSRYAPRLRSAPVAYFSVCLTPAVHPLRAAEAPGYAVPLTLELGIHPVSARAFPGVYVPSELSFIDRTKANLWGARPGDFRDLAAIDSWALGLAAKLGAADQFASA